MHAVRVELVRRQAEAAGLPLRVVEIPHPCSNDEYEAAFRGRGGGDARREGVRSMAFGDLFLADVRAYRERLLAGTGVEPLFPLWGRDTARARARDARRRAARRRHLRRSEAGPGRRSRAAPSTGRSSPRFPPPPIPAASGASSTPSPSTARCSRAPIAGARRRARAARRLRVRGPAAGRTLRRSATTTRRATPGLCAPASRAPGVRARPRAGPAARRRRRRRLPAASSSSAARAGAAASSSAEQDGRVVGFAAVQARGPPGGARRPSGPLRPALRSRRAARGAPRAASGARSSRGPRPSRAREGRTVLCLGVLARNAEARALYEPRGSASASSSLEKRLAPAGDARGVAW